MTRLFVLLPLLCAASLQAQVRSTGSPDFGNDVSGVLDMGPMERVYGGHSVQFFDDNTNPYVPDCTRGCLQVENFTDLDLVGIYIDMPSGRQDLPSNRRNLFGYTDYTVPPHSGIRTERRWSCKADVWVKFVDRKTHAKAILAMPAADFCANEAQSETHTTVFKFGNSRQPEGMTPASLTR